MALAVAGSYQSCEAEQDSFRPAHGRFVDAVYLSVVFIVRGSFSIVAAAAAAGSRHTRLSAPAVVRPTVMTMIMSCPSSGNMRTSTLFLQSIVSSIILGVYVSMARGCGHPWRSRACLARPTLPFPATRWQSRSRRPSARASKDLVVWQPPRQYISIYLAHIR